LSGARLFGIEAAIAAGAAIWANVDQTGHESFHDTAGNGAGGPEEFAIWALVFCSGILHAHSEYFAYAHNLNRGPFVAVFKPWERRKVAFLFAHQMWPTGTTPV
jgi:hypothetical protein